MINNIYDFSCIEELIQDCMYDDFSYELFPGSGPSPYATCFAVFLFHFYGKKIKSKNKIVEYLRNEVISSEKNNNILSKKHLQLLSFTLSAIFIINKKQLSIFHTNIINVKKTIEAVNLKKFLLSINAQKGVPQSGNIAMLIAIIFIIDNKFFSKNSQNHIDEWLIFFKENYNKIKLWGDYKNNPFLVFQNSYHQLEIFFHQESEDFSDEQIQLLLKNVDNNGHFAPYPGGGSCYDYDAVFILSKFYKYLRKPNKKVVDHIFKKLKQDLIINNLSYGFGFCESRLCNTGYFRNHILFNINKIKQNGIFHFETIKYFLFRIKNGNQINTHWTKNHRRWDQENLWDTWFRLLTISRIDYILGNKKNLKKRFINFPGIGYF